MLQVFCRNHRLSIIYSDAAQDEDGDPVLKLECNVQDVAGPVKVTKIADTSASKGNGSDLTGVSDLPLLKFCHLQTVVQAEPTIFEALSPAATSSNQ